MNILDQFGANPELLKDQVSGTKIVPDRVAHIDADFLAYIVAADTSAEKEEQNFRSLQHKAMQLHDFAHTVRKAAGAEYYVLHVTPSGSTKGGRYEQAVQAEYQATRNSESRQVPEHLHVLRAFIAQKMRSVVSMDQEADDAMTQAAYADFKNTVICSRDKDLLSVPGFRLDTDTSEVLWTEPGDYGRIWIDDTKSSKKILGTGPAFFFAQCLMGDSADNIKGVPAIAGTILEEKKPTAEQEKARKRWLAEPSEINEQRFHASMGKSKPCGPVLTFDVLSGITSCKDAFHFVKHAFVELNRWHEYDYRHWKTDAIVTPTQALMGDMLCLWMRRSKNPNDVLSFLKETCV